MAALAIATRDALKADSFYTTLPREAGEVTIQINERAPIVAGDVAVVIYHGSEEAGPVNGTVSDTIYGLDISVFIRSTVKPRDQFNEFWFENASGLQEHQANIKRVVHMNYTILTNANTEITTLEGAGQCGFNEPLRYAGAGPIREARPQLYDATVGDTPAGVVQQYRFRGARRMEP